MLQILLPVFFLYIFGVFNVLGIRNDLLINNFIFLGISIFAFVATRFIGLNYIKQNARFFYWLFIAILIITYFIGFEAKGSQRWINLYFFNFQPSEFFKVFFIVFISSIFARLRKDDFPFSLLLKCIGYFLIPTFIILKQPDLGSAMVYVFIFVSMLFISPLSKKYFLAMSIVAILLLPVIWHTSHDYQKSRILAFLNPSEDQAKASYNMTQALITVGSGQFAGKGLGMGKQSRLYFLPEYHTDFAYSSLVEQFGFIGGFVVILLYMALFFFIIQKIFYFYRQNDEFNKFRFYYSVGFFAFLFFQTFVNIGMNIGILPIAGITLPLISYGGSSLMTIFIGLALLI